jgi:alditol oxidase
LPDRCPARPRCPVGPAPRTRPVRVSLASGATGQEEPAVNPDRTGRTTNWAGNVTYGAARVHHPDSVAQLRRLVAGARHIRALGTGHTFNAIADSPGDLVSLDRLPSTVDIDRDRSTVTVGGGVRYGELSGRLHAAGYALHNLGSLPHICIAGACATGTHGSGTGCLAAAVSALEYVDPHGDLVRVERGGDEFCGSVVALGALGIVTSLTLDIEPAYDVTQRVYLDLPLAEARERLADLLTAGYSVSLFTDWGPRVGQIWVKSRLDRGAPRQLAGATPAAGPVHPVPGMPPEHCTEQLGVPGPWHERLPHFRLAFTPSSGSELQSEYLVPAQSGGQALAEVAAIGDRLRPVLQIAEVRSVSADELWLSPSYRRDSVALHFTWVDDTRAVLPVVAALEERLAPFEPRPHWGKLFAMQPQALRAAYPRLDDAARLLRRRDPAGKFRNALVDRWLGLTPGTP